MWHQHINVFEKMKVKLSINHSHMIQNTFMKKDSCLKVEVLKDANCNLHVSIQAYFSR